MDFFGFSFTLEDNLPLFDILLCLKEKETTVYHASLFAQPQATSVAGNMQTKYS